MSDKTVTPESLRKYYFDTFKSEAGSMVLKDLCNRCFKNNSTYEGTETQVFINEGRRQVLIHIENMISEIGRPPLTETKMEDTIL